MWLGAHKSCGDLESRANQMQIYVWWLILGIGAIAELVNTLDASSEGCTSVGLVVGPGSAQNVSLQAAGAWATTGVNSEHAWGSFPAGWFCHSFIHLLLLLSLLLLLFFGVFIGYLRLLGTISSSYE